VANPSNGARPCWRYNRAQERLGRIKDQDELAAERVASIMDAVHVESPTGSTVRTVVADLPRRLVSVYLMFQYDAPIILSVDAEIARSPAPRAVSTLFPPGTVSRADQAYQQVISRVRRSDALTWVWLGVVGACLVALLALRRRSVPPAAVGLGFWMPVVATLGPVGLLAYLVTGHDRRRDGEQAPGMSRRLVAEVAGDLPPYVIGFVLALLAGFFIPALGGGSPFQLLVVWGLPLAGGLLFFHGPLLARATRAGYGRIVLRRLPAALVLTNLSIAAIVAVAVPLVVWLADYGGFSALAVLRFWAVTVVGALGGGLLLSGYHAWALRRGFATWSALVGETDGAAGGAASVASPSWRRLWVWVVLSLVVLVAGLVLGAMGAGAVQAR
jgi:hypothetical protein